MTLAIKIGIALALLPILSGILSDVTSLPPEMDSAIDAFLPTIIALYTHVPVLATMITMITLSFTFEMYWLLFTVANWVYDKFVG